jgi:hypothetical protein
MACLHARGMLGRMLSLHERQFVQRCMVLTYLNSLLRMAIGLDVQLTQHQHLFVDKLRFVKAERFTKLRA